MQCPQIDELPRDKGCQVRCQPQGPVCARARRKCDALPTCKSFNVNDEGTWATLKQHVPGRDRGSGSSDAYCAPALKERHTDAGLPCTSESALCIVLSKVSRRPLFSARPKHSLPLNTPVVVGSSGFPAGRQAAITHLAFFVERCAAQL